ncbi:MAG: hypothetical protein R3D26_07125 [Cyanobacteriota/Melainabacteria group bacterium]
MKISGRGILAALVLVFGRAASSTRLWRMTQKREKKARKKRQNQTSS